MSEDLSLPWSATNEHLSAKNPVENVGDVEQVWVQIHVQSNDTRMWIGMEKVQKSRIEECCQGRAPARQASMGNLHSNEGVLVRNKKFACSQREGWIYALKRVHLFFFLGGGEFGQYNIFIFFCVPTMFPKGVPNSTTLLSHMVCPKFVPSHL
jgi:hypothetical protein